MAPKNWPKKNAKAVKLQSKTFLKKGNSDKSTDNVVNTKSVASNAEATQEGSKIKTPKLVGGFKKLRQVGIVCQHEIVKGILLWTKLIVKKGNKYVTILAFKPAVEFTLGAAVCYETVEYQEKIAAVNLKLVAEENAVDFFNKLQETDKLKSVYISELLIKGLTENIEMGNLLGTIDGTILAYDSSKVYYLPN